MPVSAENVGIGTAGTSTFGCMSPPPLVSDSNSISISRAFFALVWTTATGSRQPDSVPAASTRFWSTGDIARRSSSASSESHRRLPPMKASISSRVAGLDSFPPPPGVSTATLSALLMLVRPARAFASNCSFSLACRTRDRMTPEASRQLTMVPPAMTRRWSSGFIPLSSDVATSSSQRLLAEMNFSTSSDVAGVTNGLSTPGGTGAAIAATRHPQRSPAARRSPGGGPGRA
mmetsp:Transcript_62211/g.160419  ORF Transcript_62211/g.160419 Transcript_62211/m.160419 type:complete len:232 (+) Transcript_62211:556-1251(+)